MISYVISQKVDFFNLSSHTLGADLGERLQTAFLKTSSGERCAARPALPPRCTQVPLWLCSHPAVALLILPHVLHASSEITVIFNILCKYYYLYNAFLLSFLPSASISSLIFFIFFYFFYFPFTIWLFTCNTFCLVLSGVLFLLFNLQFLVQSSGMRFGLVFLRRLLCPPAFDHVCMTLTCLPAALLLLDSCLLCLSLLCENLCLWEGISAFPMTLLELSI